jgi:hypothetical protein
MNPATAIPVLPQANEALRFDRIADLRAHLLAIYGPLEAREDRGSP